MPLKEPAQIKKKLEMPEESQGKLNALETHRTTRSLSAVFFKQDMTKCGVKSWEGAERRR